MRAASRTIARIAGELRSFEGVGRAAIGTAAFGLLAFRISHGRKELGVTWPGRSGPCEVCEREGVKATAGQRQAMFHAIGEP